MNTWIIIALVWFVVGLLCWAVILRFFPPSPLIDPRLRHGPGDGIPRPFSLRDVPTIALCSVPVAALSPPLLLFLLWHRVGRHKGTGSK
jgi:hypothetical protein